MSDSVDEAKGLLQRVVANEEQKAKSAAAAVKEQPKTKKTGRARIDFLSPQEERFIEHYLLTGAAATAAEQAGYEDPEKAGRHLLARRLVRERIQRVLSTREAEKVSISRKWILDEIKTAILQAKPFERIKALELVAKMEGYMAPRRSIIERVKSSEVSPYVELAETLKSSGASWTREQRDVMRQQLLSDRAAIDEVLALIEKTPAAVN